MLKSEPDRCRTDSAMRQKFPFAFEDYEAQCEGGGRIHSSAPVRLRFLVRLDVEGRRSADPTGWRPGPRRASPMSAIETRLTRRALVAGGFPRRLLAPFPPQTTPHRTTPVPPTYILS